MTPRTPLPPAPPADPPAGTPAARRRAARALGDAALVAALASGDAAVWAEFDARFRPLLEVHARRVGIPPELWPRCIDDVLADEAMRLSEGAPVPERLSPYLVRAAYHAFLKERRSAARRRARYATAADAPPGPSGHRLPADAEPVVASGCSDAVRRASAGPGPADVGPPGWEPAAGDDGTALGSPVLADVLAVLLARLTDAERQLLAWVAEQVPRRQIAQWTGENYETTRKRVQRLTHRLQAEALRHAATLAPGERHEFARFLRRAGYASPGAPPISREGAARAAVAPRLSGRAAFEDLP